MTKQCSFVDMGYSQKKGLTRREAFLSEVEAVISWSRLIALIELHYPKSGKQDCQPKGLEVMFRIRCMRHCFFVLGSSNGRCLV